MSNDTLDRFIDVAKETLLESDLIDSDDLDDGELEDALQTVADEINAGDEINSQNTTETENCE